MGIYKPGRPAKYAPDTGKGSKPPAKPGEYRLRNPQGAITYIGETCDLARRTYQHIHSGKLRPGDTVEYKVVDGRSTSATRREHEREKSAQHQPALNRSRGGEGRIAAKTGGKKRAGA